MRLRPSMPPEQMSKARVPKQIGATRQRHCLRIGRRNDDEAAEAELGKGGRTRMHLWPNQPIAVDGQTGFIRRVEAYDIEIAARGAFGAIRHVHAVPDRRMWF